MSSVKQLLPYDVKNALIEVCGCTFWLKQPLFDTFDRAGIPEEYYLKYEQEPKFKIARKLLADLERMGDYGFLLQRQLVTELHKFSRIPDPTVPDQDAAIRALRTLKEATNKHDSVLRREEKIESERACNIGEYARNISERKRKLKELNQEFKGLSNSSNHQDRGYKLERILYELFTAHEIEYKKSYRGDGEQIDGFFYFAGFGYIVESRWRKNVPNFDELMAIIGKVDRKIESTRGFVVSMAGFDDRVLQRLRQVGPAKLILMNGYDLALILEEHVSLTDALQEKINRATQEGMMFFPVCRMLS